MKTRDEIKGIQLPHPVRPGRSAATVVVATVLFVATVVAVLVMAFRTDGSPAGPSAPAPPPVTVEYYGAPAD